MGKRRQSKAESPFEEVVTLAKGTIEDNAGVFAQRPFVSEDSFASRGARFPSLKEELVELLSKLEEEFIDLIDKKTAFFIMEKTPMESLKYTSGQLSALIYAKTRIQETATTLKDMV